MRRSDRNTPMVPTAETATSMLKGDSQFAEVVNMAPTEEGTLRSINTPRDLIPRTFRPYSLNPMAGGPLTYEKVYSIGYARLQGGMRHVILIHEGSQIKEFRGWERRWRAIIGTDVGAQISESIREPSPGEPGVQFVATANGIVIIPPDGRAYFYDGDIVARLGYDREPAAPEALGPKSSTTEGKSNTSLRVHGTNDTNYTSDGLKGFSNSVHMAFQGGRLGTVSEAGAISFGAPAAAGGTEAGLENYGAGVKGYLQTGLYRGYVQFIDRWGNLSPISQPSADITFDQQVAKHQKLVSGGGPVSDFVWARAELAKKRVAWVAPRGPSGTIGRILGRTRDVASTGDSRRYVLPLNAASVIGAFATLPDNAADLYPDNIPDAWLTTEMTDVDPVPVFRNADVAFGRLWVVGIRDDPSALMISMPGKWGTFPKNSRRYPDPRGEPLVAVKAVPQGVLVFTRNSVFLYRANDAGDDFVAEPINTGIGCYAPLSVDVLPNGMTIWLGRDGFYGFDGSTVISLWRGKHEFVARQHNISMLGLSSACVERMNGEYRCWVPVRGSYTPNRCYTTTDGRTWRWRTDLEANGVVSASDDDQLVLVAGAVGGTDGVYVMDKGEPSQEAYLDSGWILNESGGRRQNTHHVYVRLRETGKGSALPIRPAGAAESNPWRVQLEVSRDYRGEVIQTTHKPLWPDKVADVGSYWGVTPTNTATIRRARPFLVRFDIDVSSCESFRFKLSASRDFEIVDVMYTTSAVMAGKREH